MLIGAGEAMRRARHQAQQSATVAEQQAEILRLAQVLIRDLDDRIIHWNVGAQQLYGFEPQEAIGQVSHDLLATVFPEPLTQIRQTLMSNGS